MMEWEQRMRRMEILTSILQSTQVSLTSRGSGRGIGRARVLESRILRSCAHPRRHHGQFCWLLLRTVGYTHAMEASEKTSSGTIVVRLGACALIGIGIVFLVV